MKKLCCFVAIAVCLGIAGVAHATSMDFSLNILDPAPPGVNPITSNTFDVVFSACSAYTLSPPVAADGCFEGINDTGVLPNTTAETWTSLVITIPDPTDVLGMDNATCGVLGGNGIFNSTSCTESGDTYTLSFSDGTIAPDDVFFIEETGVTASDFPEGTAVASDAPEPNSALLLATGTAMFGLLLYAERRRRAGQPLSS
jgi:hypothetical protein